jgi:hypothetical protein
VRRLSAVSVSRSLSVLRAVSVRCSSSPASLAGRSASASVLGAVPVRCSSSASLAGRSASLGAVSVRCSSSSAILPARSSSPVYALLAVSGLRSPSMGPPSRSAALLARPLAWVVPVVESSVLLASVLLMLGSPVLSSACCRARSVCRCRPCAARRQPTRPVPATGKTSQLGEDPQCWRCRPCWLAL